MGSAVSSILSRVLLLIYRDNIYPSDDIRKNLHHRLTDFMGKIGHHNGHNREKF